MELRMIYVVLTLLFSLSPLTSLAVNDTSSSDKYIYTENKLNVIVESNHPEFTIKLKSNPGTGFSWFLREYDVNQIQPLKHSFVAPTQKLLGAPGFEIWTFKVKSQGFIVPQQSVIRLIYARPWQGADNSTQAVFRVTTAGK